MKNWCEEERKRERERNSDLHRIYCPIDAMGERKRVRREKEKKREPEIKQECDKKVES